MSKKLESTVDSDFFQLSNGQYIMSKELSACFSIIMKEQPHYNFDYKWDELSMAELFATCYANNTRYCPEMKCWYSYDGTKWVRDTGALLAQERLKDFTRLMQLYCSEIPDEDVAKRYRIFVSKLGDRRVRDRVLKDATGVNPISSVMFDNDPYLINCLNGTYDLRDCSFREHNWRDFLTMTTNFEHTVSKNLSYPRWDDFIKEVTCGDNEVADFIQRALGYTLLGKSNEECMFILHGKTTRNGKSTLLDTLYHILGDYAQSVPVGLICKGGASKDYSAANPTLVKLKGARMVVMSESDEYGKMDEQAIKQYTGGGAVTARPLYGEQMSFVPQFKMWLSCNSLPSVSDKSLFASDRIKLVEFNRHFSETEQDKSLKEQFQTKEAMQYIFLWAVAGYMRYKRKGLTISEDMKKVVRKYEKDNDVVMQFFESKCVVQEDSKVSGNTLYNAYKFWCKENGFFSKSSIKFYSDFERFAERYKLDGCQTFRNIALRNGSSVAPSMEGGKEKNPKIKLN